jgi:threonine dehydratase
MRSEVLGTRRPPLSRLSAEYPSARSVPDAAPVVHVPAVILVSAPPGVYRSSMDAAMPRIGIDDIRLAAERIRLFAKRTPVLTSSTIDAMTGAAVFFKCESFQRVGAFKFRGACNAVFSLDEATARRGVATHSSGNHAQALALAARLRGISACIVMPRDAPRVKVDAVKGYGARIVFSGNEPLDRERTLDEVVRETGAEFVHPSDDPRVIAGQGTCALEILEEVPGLDMVVAPVGGGGLLSGTALAVRAVSPDTGVVGAEPEAADDAYRSFTTGTLHLSRSPRTVADGLRTSLGPNTFPIVRARVDAIVTVSEEAIVRAMRLVWERMKIVIEPSAAVPVAALLEGTLAAAGKRVAIILSGGNVDLDALPWARPSA